MVRVRFSLGALRERKTMVVGRPSKPCSAGPNPAARSTSQARSARCRETLPTSIRRVQFPPPALSGALFREQHGLQNRGARFNSATRLECPCRRLGSAFSKRRRAGSTPARGAMSHSSSGPGRRPLKATTRVRFPHATLRPHPWIGYCGYEPRKEGPIPSGGTPSLTDSVLPLRTGWCVVRLDTEALRGA